MPRNNPKPRTIAVLQVFAVQPGDETTLPYWVPVENAVTHDRDEASDMVRRFASHGGTYYDFYQTLAPLH